MAPSLFNSELVWRRPLPAKGLRAALLLTLCLYAAAACAHAQYSFDSWTTDRGLPQNAVQSILQARDGYLWLTTSDGLVRFDGIRFTVFNRSNTKGISSNRLSALYEDREGTLWVGADDRGLMRYKDGVFKTFTVEDGLPYFWIWAIREDAEGHLLVVTQNGMARLNGERFVPFVPEGGLTTRRYWEQRYGGLSFYDATGLYEFEGGRYRAFPARDGFSDRTIRSMYEDQYGTLWVATRDRKLHELKGEAHRVYDIGELSDEAVTAVCEDHSGNIWIAQEGGGVSRLWDGKFTRFTVAEGAPGKALLSIYEDREGNIWLGSNGDGLYRVKRQLITTYSERDGLSYDNVSSVLEDRLGNIWVGTFGRGLDRLAGGAFKHFTERTGIAGNQITALLEDSAGSLWIGSLGRGVTRLQGEKATVYIEDTGLRGNTINAIYQDRTGSYLIGHTGGLFEYRDGLFSRHPAMAGLADTNVRAILQDRSGRFWFGTLGGITCYQDGKITNYTERDGLSGNHIRTLYEDDEGTLWIGTYDAGLNRFKDGVFTRYTVNEGLFNNGVFCILEDAHGNFWISSNRGIYRVSRRELNDFAEGRVKSVTSISYDKSDGMINSECNGGYQPSGLKTRDGRLWFPTQGGVAVVDPEAVRQGPPPPVHIEEVLLDQEAAELGRAVRVAPGSDNVEIRFTALSFTKPEQIRFKYKLEGFDDDWVNARSRRSAYYTKLPPGEYVFSVIASNSDGVWNSQGASIRVIVVPPFWRTWWFISFCLLSLFALGFLAYRRRILKLQRAHAAHQAFSRQLIESQELERKRIAGELHDSLGHRLLLIKNHALLALNTSDSREEVAEQLQEISEASSHALDEVREIAHNLRPFQLDRLGLTKALESMLRKVSGTSGINFSIKLDSLDGLYSQEAETNIYRIVQESVNNIVRHSGAASAGVEVLRDARGVSIKVYDDGRGFAYGPGGEHPPGSGMGLAGISERTRILGGTCEIRSAPGEGTTTLIKLGLNANGTGSGAKS